MSRCGYYDGEDAIPEGLWDQAFYRATTTPKGIKRLCEFAGILDAMPHRRLISDALKSKEGEVCFVGAICEAKKLEHLPVGECDIYDTAQAGKDAGIPWTLAWEMARMNDEKWGNMTPEERWQAARSWIDETIAKARIVTRPTFPLSQAAEAVRE